MFVKETELTVEEGPPRRASAALLSKDDAKVDQRSCLLFVDGWIVSLCLSVCRASDFNHHHFLLSVNNFVHPSFTYDLMFFFIKLILIYK